MVTKHQSYPARLTIDYPEQLDRVSSFFRLIFVIPILVILTLLTANASDTVTVITDSGEVHADDVAERPATAVLDRPDS